MYRKLIISRFGLPLLKAAISIARTGGGTYDRNSFIRNNIFTFIRTYIRNYRCICLDYIKYNFKQIKKIKPFCLDGEWFFKLLSANHFCGLSFSYT